MVRQILSHKYLFCFDDPTIFNPKRFIDYIGGVSYELCVKDSFLKIMSDDCVLIANGLLPQKLPRVNKLFQKFILSHVAHIQLVGNDYHYYFNNDVRQKS